MREMQYEWCDVEIAERDYEIEPKLALLPAWRDAMHACPISDPLGVVNHDGRNIS